MHETYSILRPKFRYKFGYGGNHFVMTRVFFFNWKIKETHASEQAARLMVAKLNERAGWF